MVTQEQERRRKARCGTVNCRYKFSNDHPPARAPPCYAAVVVREKVFGTAPEKPRATTAATPTAAAVEQLRSLETAVEGTGSTATRTDSASQSTIASTQPPELAVPASKSGESEPSAAVQGSGCGGLEEEAALATASLWDRAVVQLAASDAKLVADYEELLLKHLIGTEDATATNAAATDAIATDAIAENAVDRPMLDRNQLDRMLHLGLDRKEKNKLEYMVFGKKFVIEDKISEATDLVLKFKNLVSEAVKVSPEASLAWAGVCVILPLFTNPSTAYEAQSSGFHYVTSRVQLYAEYENRVRKRGSVVRDEMTIQLEALLVDLYKELLRFQLRTVVYFYRSWIKKTVKGSLLSDEWESMVNKVKDAEGTVAEYLSRLQETDMISTLKEMKSTANKRCADLKTLLDVSMRILNVLEDAKHLNERRLDVQIIAEACHNSAEVTARGQCLGGTRSKLKGQIATWFNSQAGPNMLWLTGPAGTGKSTVSLTVADEYAKDRRLAASYFFSRARQGAGEILQFLPTIASQLAQNFAAYKSILRDALIDMSGETLAKKSLETQFDILFRGLLKQQDIGSVNEECQLVVVDALDECKQQTSLRELVHLRKSHKVHNQQPSIDYLACVSSASWLITLSTDGRNMQVWDTKKAICLRTIRIRAKSPHHELYSPDQMRRRTLVSGNGKVVLIGASNHEIQVWSITTGACIRVFQDEEKRISPVALSPDGQRFALDTENSQHFHVYGLDSNVPMRVKKETKCTFSDKVSSFQALFSPESAIFAYVVGNEIYLTDMDTTERSSWCLSLDKPVTCVEFSADSQLLAACLPFGEIVIWDISGSVCNLISNVQWETQMPIAEVAFSENGLHVGAMGFNQYFAIWDIATGAAVELVGVRSLQQRTDVRWVKQRFSFHVGEGSHVATLWGVREFAPDDEQLMYAGYGLSEHFMWIMKGSEKIIYLPPEYRCRYEPYVINSVVVLRHDTRKMLLLKLTWARG
ncbi:hypothetical protein G3M48_001859 [Beauveria asiatica]|uniref:Vegetative incompatibility protein HET-E-1 n=1 Tax=Beauveria asiatica TaxID=1069075 RepID=A0AAW0RY50_9HYPO